VIEDIDDKSIKEIGSWPPDRNTFSKLMTNLHKFGAKTVALDVLFSEKSINPVDLILNSEFIAYYTYFQNFKTGISSKIKISYVKLIDIKKILNHLYIIVKMI
jgi:hypothetical protein